MDGKKKMTSKEKIEEEWFEDDDDGWKSYEEMKKIAGADENEIANRDWPTLVRRLASIFGNGEFGNEKSLYKRDDDKIKAEGESSKIKGDKIKAEGESSKIKGEGESSESYGETEEDCNNKEPPTAKAANGPPPKKENP